MSTVQQSKELCLQRFVEITEGSLVGKQILQTFPIVQQTSLVNRGVCSKVIAVTYKLKQMACDRAHKAYV